MASLSGFNANDVEPNNGFDPIPPAEYPAAIVNSEEVQNKAGTGSYHKLEFEVLDGPYKGRKLWENLNLNNPSEQAVNIARGTLSAICRAVGVLTPNDTVELHNIPLVIKVGMEKRNDTGELQNRIKAYKAKGTTPTGTTAAAPGGPAPWQKKVS